MSGVDGGAPVRDYAAAAARATKGIEQHINDLRQMIENESTSRVEYERLVEESKQRERRLVKAVAALEGEPLGAWGKAPKAKPRAQPKGPQLVDPRVADELLVVVKQLIEQTGENTVTRTQLVKAMEGIKSGETVRRGLKLLREQERIRVAGKAGSGGPTSAILYALMPNGD